jgi:hypothetical protein
MWRIGSAMKLIGFVPLVLIAVLLLLSGCTTPWSNGNGGSSVPSPGPVQTLPPGQDVTIQINEKDTSYATITILFSGGEEQIAVRDIVVRVTRPDGAVLTEHLPPVKGAEVTIQGSRETDRIEVFVTLNTGITYKIIDRLLPFRTRG